MNWFLPRKVPLMQRNWVKTFFFPTNLLGKKKSWQWLKTCGCITKKNLHQTIEHKMTKSPNQFHDFSWFYLSEGPGELHVLGGRVAALQEPRPAVHVHQTLVVVIVDGWAQHSQLELLGAGVVDILQTDRNNKGLTHVSRLKYVV